MITLNWQKIDNTEKYKEILSSYTGTMGFDADSGTMATVKNDVNAYAAKFSLGFENNVPFVLLDFGVIENIIKLDMYLNGVKIGDTSCNGVEFRFLVPAFLLNKENELVAVIVEGVERDIWINGVIHKNSPENFVSVEKELPSALNIPDAPKNRSIKYIKKEGNCLSVTFSDNKELLIKVYEKGVIRLTMNPCNNRAVEEYCTDELEHNLEKYSDFECKSNPEFASLYTERSVVEIYPHKIIYKDLNYEVLSEISLVCETENLNGVSVKLQENEAVFGLGENAVDGFNKRGTREDIWVSHHLEKCDVPIPFYFTNKKYGLYLNTSYHSVFDMGMLDKDNALITVMEKTLDIFLFNDENPKELVTRFSEITGKPKLPPKWAFGFWQAGMKIQSTKDALESLECFKKYDIPIDVMCIDPGWERGHNDYRWHETNFPDPKKFIEGLKNNDIHLILWTSPFVNTNCDNFEDGIKNRAFMIDENGNHKNAIWWKGFESGIIDYFNGNSVKWLSKRVGELLDEGVEGFKVDGGDSGDVPCTACSNSGLDGKEIHNLFPLAFAKEMQNIILSKKPGKRPVTWERTGYTGSGKYPCTWGGDQLADFSGARVLIKAGQMCSLVGIPFWSEDVGGFCLTDKTSEETFIRSYQWGVLAPLARAHGQKTRPWDYTEMGCRIAGDYIRLRHRLLPYIYSLACSAVKLEGNIMYPLFLDNFNDEKSYDACYQYMLGEYMMIAPIFEESGTEDLTATRTVYFPEGKWYDIRNWEMTDGKCEKSVSATIDELPIYYREGAIIPMTKHHEKASKLDISNLEITIIPSENKSVFKLYDDDGESFDYLDGVVSITEISQSNGVIEIKTLNDAYKISKALNWTFKVLTDKNTVKINGETTVSNRDGRFICFDIIYNQGDSLKIQIEE